MKELKFRVWDSINKKMFSFEECIWKMVNISTSDGGNYDVPLFSVAFIDNKTKLIPQQFTGLKDKNGKDIYEGDIVKYSMIYRKDKISEVKWDNYSDGEYCQTIECWMIGGCSLSDAIYSSQFGYGPASEIEKNSIEVIGNIFENPELIK